MKHKERKDRPDTDNRRTIHAQRTKMDFWRLVKVDGSNLANRIAIRRMNGFRVAPDEYVTRLRRLIDEAVGRIS